MTELREEIAAILGRHIGEEGDDYFGREITGIGEATDAILALPEIAGGWQPIETAPRDGTEVLICWADIPQMAVAQWDQDYAEMDFAEGVGWRDGSDYGCGGMIGAMPTHWMPLPPPPTKAP